MPHIARSAHRSSTSFCTLFRRISRAPVNKNRRIASILAAAATAAALAPSARAYSTYFGPFPEWSQENSGTYSWFNSSNWASGVVANGGSTGADITDDEGYMTGPETINLDNNVTLQELLIGNDYEIDIDGVNNNYLTLGNGATAWILPDSNITNVINAPLYNNSSNLIVQTWLNNVENGTTVTPDAISVPSGIGGGQNVEITNAILLLGGESKYGYWSGNTTLDGGQSTLSLTATGALPYTTNLSLTDSTDAVYVGATFQNVNTLSGNGTLYLNAGGEFSILSNSTFSGALNGPANSQVDANGCTVTLSGNNSNFAGTLYAIGSASRFVIPSASSAGAGQLNLNSGTFESTSSYTLGNNFYLQNTATIAPDLNTTLTLTGIIAELGTATLSVGGQGTLVLTNSDNYMAAIKLLGGTLSASSAGALGSGLITLDGTLGATANVPFSNNINIPTNDAGTLSVNSTHTLTVNGDITGGGSLSTQGAGSVYLTDNNNEFSGGLYVGADTQFTNEEVFGNEGGSVNFIGGTLELLSNNNAATSRNLNVVYGTPNAIIDVDSNSTFTVNGVVSDSYGGGDVGERGGLIAEGLGTLVLGNSGNAYHGTTTIDGNLSVSSDGDLGASGNPIQFGDTVTVNGHLIDLIPGTLYSTSTFSMSNRPVDTGSVGATFDVAPGTTLTVPGVIADSGFITKQNTGTLVLTGANTFSGGIQVNAGTLAVQSTSTTGFPANTNPLGTGTVVLNGGTLALKGVINPTTQQVIAATGYNKDVVVEAGVSPANAHLAASPFDPDNNFAFYEYGYNGHTTGLPTNPTFTSGQNSNVTFQLQSYTSNNCLLLGAGATGSLTLSQPGEFSNINILAASSGGPIDTTITLDFADGTQQSYVASINDWFTNTTGALTANGRIALGDGSIQNENSGYPRLYEFDVPVGSGNLSKVLDAISFNPTNGEDMGVFAVSGYGTIVAPQQTYLNSVQLTADSTISVGGGAPTVMSSLTQGTNTLYTTGAAGSSLTFLNSTLSGNPTFDVAPGVYLDLSNSFGTTSITGGLTKNNGGTMEVDANIPGTVTVNGGKLILGNSVNIGTLSINGANTVQLAAGLHNIGSLALSPTATLDITNSEVLLSYTTSDPISSIAALLKSGYNGGAWNGPGIISTSAQTLTSGLRYGVGWADGADKIAGHSVVSGLTSGQIEMKYTLLGDANLDGTVNGSDFSILAADFGQGSSSWDQGNFVFTPAINGSDFAALAANFGQGDSGASATVSQADIAALDSFAIANDLPLPTIAPVPEPASIAAILLTAIGSLSRRRRR